MGETVDKLEELALVVGLAFGGNRRPPRSGKRALVDVVESRGTRTVGIPKLVVVGR